MERTVVADGFAVGDCAGTDVDAVGPECPAGPALDPIAQPASASRMKPSAVAVSARSPIIPRRGDRL